MVCVEILQALKVIHFRTVFEADDTIAFISEKLNCPILSNDTDFQIYQKTGIIIPFSAIEFRRVVLKGGSGKKVHSLFANIVNLKRLCEELFQFPTAQLALLPFLGVIIGNDKLPPSCFDHVKTNNNSSERIKSILEWIKNSTASDSKKFHKRILQEVREPELERYGKLIKVEERISEILNSYNDCEGAEPALYDLLISEGGFVDAASITYKEVKSSETQIVIFGTEKYETNCNSDQDLKKEDTKIATILHQYRSSPKANMIENIPDWLLERHLRCKLPDDFIEFMINKKFWMLPQIEVKDFDPSQKLSLDIIRIIGGLLHGDELISLVVMKGMTSEIRMYKTNFNLATFGPVPCLTDPAYQKNEHYSQRLIIEALNCLEYEEFITEWPSTLRLTVMLIICFLKEKPFFFSAAIAALLSFLKETFVSNDGPICTNFSITDKISSLIKAQKMTRKLEAAYTRLESENIIMRRYEILNPHFFSEFRCVFIHGRNLNMILGNPYKLPKLKDLNSFVSYNCAETFNLYEDKFSVGFRNLFGDEPISLILEKFWNLTYERIMTESYRKAYDEAKARCISMEDTEIQLYKLLYQRPRRTPTPPAENGVLEYTNDDAAADGEENLGTETEDGILNEEIDVKNRFGKLSI